MSKEQGAKIKEKIPLNHALPTPTLNSQLDNLAFDYRLRTRDAQPRTPNYLVTVKINTAKFTTTKSGCKILFRLWSLSLVAELLVG